MKFKFYLFSLVIGLLMCSVNLLAETCTISEFTAVSGNNGIVQYSAVKGDGTVDPAIISNNIRIYRNNKTTAKLGGKLTVTPFNSSYVIQSITFNLTKSLGYSVSYNNNSATTGNNNAITVSDASITTVTLQNNSTSQMDVKSIVVTYSIVSSEKHTAKFYINGDSLSNEFYEGDAVVFPANPEVDGYSFVGWTTSPIVGTENEAPTPLVTSATMGSEKVDYYAVFASLGANKEEELSKTLSYDTWTYSGSTTDKTSYRLFHKGSYVESKPFDLSTLTKVIVYGGTFGGTSYNSLSIKDNSGYTWKDVTVSGSDQTGENTFTGGNQLSGTGTLRVYSTCGTASGTGVRMSKIEIYTKTKSGYENYWTTKPASKTVESISVKTVPTTITYAEGDNLDLSGLVLTVTYDDKSTDEITKGFTASPEHGSTLKSSDTKVTFTYNGQTCEQEIYVLSLTSISVKTPPTKTTYREGESIDLTGVVIDGLYGSDVHRDISGWTASPANGAKLTTSDTEVTFTYKEKTCTQTITVNEIPSHNVTWSVNGVENVVTYKEGIDIAFADPASNLIPKGYEFMGWTTSKITGEPTTEAPKYVTSATMGNGDITYYAVFGKNSAGNDQYSFTINDTYFNTSSYAGNDGEHEFKATNTSGTKMDVYVQSENVMRNATNIQFKKDYGTLYNTTPLGKILSITAEPTKTMNYYYGETVNPNSSSTVGGSYFTIKNGDETNLVASITVTFIPVSYSYCTYVNVTPHLTWSDDKETVTLFNNGKVCKSQTATASNGAKVTYSITGSGNAIIDENRGEVLVDAAGTYTVTASAVGMDPISYTLNVVDPVINISGTKFSEENPTATFTSNGVKMELLCEDPEILVENEGNTISVDITKSCTITAYAYDEYENVYSKDFTVSYIIPQNYNVTWMVNGEPINSLSIKEGTKVTNPHVEDIPGYEFTGWVTSPIVGSLDTEPEFFSGIMPANDITLYAVFATVKNSDENVMTSVTSTLSTGVYYLLGRDKESGSHNYYAVTGNVANKKLLATNVTDAVTENIDKTISLDISNDVVDNSNMRYFVTVDGNDVELKMVGAKSPILLKQSKGTELTNQAGIGWVYSHSDSDEKTFYIQAKNTTRGLIIRENAVVKGYSWGNRGGTYQGEVIYNDAKFYFLRGGVLSGYRTSVDTRELVGIEIKKEPKILYTVGSTFDPSGLVLTGTFKDIYGEITKEEIAYDEELFTFDPSLSNVYNNVGDYVVTITYKGQSTTLTIKVVNPGTILAKSVVGGSYTVQVASEPAVEVTTENKEISATQGATVTLTATPDDGYKASSNLFKVYANTIVDGNPVQVSLPLNKVADNKYTFTMPVNDAVEIVTTFQQLFAIISTDESITAVEDKDGTPITEASLGSKVVLTPKVGNKLVYYVRSDDQLRVYVGKDANEKYSFSMPARNITVYSTTGDDAGDYTVSENVLTFHKNNPTTDEVSNAISENSSVNVINLSLINISSTVVNELSGSLNGKNTLIYTVASSARPNVVVVKGSMDEESRTCANFVLTDLVDFGPYTKGFTAAKTSYSRSNTAGYNSVCLPFVIDYSEVKDVFGDDAQIYKFTGVEIVDGRATSLTFMPFGEGSIGAGVPVLVNNAQETDSWTVVLTTDKNVTLNPTTSPGISSVLNGAFVKKTIGTGYYKLNSTGAYFLKTGASSVVSPFRFYLSVDNSPSAPQQLPMFRLGEDEETGIKILGDEKNSDRVYDLSGRSVEKVVAPGLYIVNGKKMLLK